MNAPNTCLCLLVCTLLFIYGGGEEPEEHVKIPLQRRSIGNLPSSMDDDRLKKELRRRKHDFSQDSGTMEDDNLKRALRNNEILDSGTMEDDNLKKQLRRQRLYDRSDSSGTMEDDVLKRNRFKDAPRYRRRLLKPKTVVERYGNYTGDVLRHKTKHRNKIHKKQEKPDFSNRDTFKKKQENKLVKKSYNFPFYRRIEVPAYKEEQ